MIMVNNFLIVALSTIFTFGVIIFFAVRTVECFRYDNDEGDGEYDTTTNIRAFD